MNAESTSSVSETAALTEWRERRSAEAFRALVERHYGWVLATARRRLNGRETLAAEVAQDVFTELARKAHRIHPHCLGGWLHRHTMFCAAKALRGESRREAREAEGGRIMNEHTTLSESDREAWKDLSPHLDDSLQSLPDIDREALVLRYFRALPLAEVGEAIGLSAGSAQKRVERALERLRLALERRGVSKSAVWLGTVLAAAAAPPPTRAAVAEKVTHEAVKSASAVTAGGVSWVAVAAAVALCAGTGGWLGHRSEGSKAPPVPVTAARAEAGAAASDPFSDRLAALLQTGKDGLPGLRSLRLAAALADEPDALIPALARYATAHTSDAAVLEALLHRWSLIDVKAAWAHFSTHGGRPEVLVDGLVQMARRDPAGAAALYGELPDGKDRPLAKALMAGLGASDPAFARQQAVLLARKMPPYQGGALLTPLYEAWALRDPKAAAEAAAIGDPELNLRGQPPGAPFANTMRLWAERDPAEAAAFLQSMKPDFFDELRGRARDAALLAIVETHPERTAVWLARSRTEDIAAEGTTNAGLKSIEVRGMAGVAEKWAAADPEAALRFAAETPWPVMRRAVLLGCAAHMAEGDAKAALAFADQQKDSSLRYAMREMIARKQPESKEP